MPEMKPTNSVYEIDPKNFDRIVEVIKDMKIIMVKGLGYVIVNPNQTDPKMFRRMGDAVAKTFERIEVLYFAWMSSKTQRRESSESNVLYAGPINQAPSQYRSHIDPYEDRRYCIIRTR